MKVIMTILLTLFPYLHAQRYEVTLYSCEKEHIVVTENGNPFEITLFNLRMDDSAWAKTCSLLQTANQLEMEIDPSTQVSEPLAVYLFVDDELLQKRLIRENNAYTLIHNPEYLYEKELLQLQESDAVMAVGEQEQESTNMRFQGRLFFIFIVLSWCLMSGLALYRLHQKDIHFPFTKS